MIPAFREIDRTFILCVALVVLGMWDLVRAWRSPRDGYLLGRLAPAMMRGRLVSARVLYGVGAVSFIAGLALAPFTIHHFTSPTPSGWTPGKSCRGCAVRVIDSRPMSYETASAQGSWDGSEAALRTYGQKTMSSVKELGTPVSEHTVLKDLGEKRVGEYFATYQGAMNPTAVILIVPAGDWHVNAQFVATEADSAAHLPEVEDAVANIEGAHDFSVSPFLLFFLIFGTRLAIGILSKPRLAE